MSCSDKRMVTCPACNGNTLCPRCGGTAEIQDQKSFMGLGRKTCPKCVRMPGNCTRCKGRGVVPA